MPRSDEAEAFFVAVYEAVQEIPYGKVTSYGHIAKITGYPTRPRQVGVIWYSPRSPCDQYGVGERICLQMKALKHLPSSTAPDVEFHDGNVPWQRVINSQGIISRRDNNLGSRRQADALNAEGVTVTTARDGELHVDFGEYGWFPRRLPSREGEDDSASNAED